MMTFFSILIQRIAHSNFILWIILCLPLYFIIYIPFGIIMSLWDAIKDAYHGFRCEWHSWSMWATFKCIFSREDYNQSKEDLKNRLAVHRNEKKIKNITKKMRGTESCGK